MAAYLVDDLYDGPTDRDALASSDAPHSSFTCHTRDANVVYYSHITSHTSLISKKLQRTVVTLTAALTMGHGVWVKCTARDPSRIQMGIGKDLNL